MVSSHPLLDNLSEQTSEQMSFDQLLESPAEELESLALNSAELSDQVTGKHQDVRLYLTVLLKTYAEMIDAGVVRDAPFEVRLQSDIVYRPDIVFVPGENFDRVQDTHIDGPPGIIFEVLSRESTARDRGEKFVAYEAAGVQEYWLVDSLRQQVELYQLNPQGFYTQVRPDIAGRLRSRQLKGFIIDIDPLWKRIMPTTAEIVHIAQEMINQR